MQVRLDGKAVRGATDLATVRPRDVAGKVRRQLAVQHLVDIQALDHKITAIRAQIAGMVRSGRSEALRQERASVAVLNLVAISSTVSRWPAATLITSSYASSLVRVSRRPFTP
jgi:hypothetical protein